MYQILFRLAFIILVIACFSTISYSQVTEESGDLFVKISGIISSMPGHSGDEYADPEITDLTIWETALSYLLNGDYNLADASASGVGYDLVQFLDTSEEPNKTYYILESIGSNYWGTYVYYPDYCRPLVIQAPHPLKDFNTGKQGIHIFIETGALFYCLSGTSRCNSSSYSTCSGTTSVCSASPESYRISDLSHNTSSIYQSTTEILFNDFSNSYFIQLHGFTKLSSDPYLILSNGTQITPDPDYLVPLAKNLYFEDHVLTFKLAHKDLGWTRLRGFFNAQGRFINSSADACTTDATETSGRFINMEQEKSRLRDDVSGWDKLANALKNTFICYGNFWEGSSDTDWNTAANWRSNEVPTASENISITNNGNPLIVNQGENNPTQCMHLEIQSGASVIVNEGMGLSVNGNLSNSGTLKVKSNSTLNGSLIVMGEIWGVASVDRHIEGWSDPQHGWHFLASPVQAQAIADFHTAGSGNDFYKWDEVNQIWINRTAGGGTLNDDFETDFEIGRGYLISNSVSSLNTFTGIPTNTDISIDGLSNTGTSANSGWHLLGNPFSSSVIWNKSNWALTNIDATAKIWMENIASYLDIPSATGVIPAMQGFMVHVNTDPGSLIIDAADRAHNSVNWYKQGDAEQLRLVVHDIEGNTSQECVIRTNENATCGFDTEFDSRFLAGYAPQFYSVVGNAKLSTNTLPEISSDTKIPLGFIKNSSSEFYLEAVGLDDFRYDSVFLTDLKINRTQLLNHDPVYNFHAEEGDTPGRFLVHVSPLEISGLEYSQQFEVFSVGNVIHINCIQPLDALLSFYSVSGQLMHKFQIDNSKNAEVNLGDYKGIVIVSIASREGVVRKKVLVW